MIRKQLVVAMFLLVTISSLHAQTPTAPPVPAQLTTAKTVFLGLGGAGRTDLDGMLYSSLYQALAKAGYTLMSTPSQAEIAIEASLGGSGVQLTIVDVKTHIVLWAISSEIGLNFSQKSVDKGITTVMEKLATLASGNIPQK